MGRMSINGVGSSLDTSARHLETELLTTGPHSDNDLLNFFRLYTPSCVCIAKKDLVLFSWTRFSPPPIAHRESTAIQSLSSRAVTTSVLSCVHLSTTQCIAVIAH